MMNNLEEQEDESNILEEHLKQTWTIKQETLQITNLLENENKLEEVTT